MGTAISIRKIVLIGRIVLTAMIMLLCAWSAAKGVGPAGAEAIVDGARHDGHTMLVGELLVHVMGIARDAGDADELQALLEDDPLVRASGLIPGPEMLISSMNAGGCHLSPLLCLFRWHTPDLRCVYDCIGLRGTGEITCRQQEECVLLAGCMMFENCLALCISIIPYDQQPVIWW